MAASPTHFERISWALLGRIKSRQLVKSSSPFNQRCSPRARFKMVVCRPWSVEFAVSHPAIFPSRIHLPLQVFNTSAAPILCHHPRGEIGHFAPPVLVLITARHPSVGPRRGSLESPISGL